MLGGAGTKPRSPLITRSGKRRYPDRLVNGVAHEAKAGVNVKMTSRLAKQMDRDAELIATRQIRGAHWHFFQGAEPEVLEQLTVRGIRFTVHP